MILYTNKNIPFQVDDKFTEIVSNHKWSINNGYPGTWFRGKVIYLHHFLFGPAGKNLEWDHIDRDPLNNLEINLRKVTHEVNLRNRGLFKNNTSGHKGVYWNKLSKKWRASFSINGKNKQLGAYDKKEDAIAARKNAELTYWGIDAT